MFHPAGALAWGPQTYDSASAKGAKLTDGPGRVVLHTTGATDHVDLSTLPGGGHAITVARGTAHTVERIVRS